MNLNLHQRPALQMGDPDKFSVRIEFVPNLDPGFASPEEDLSWGRMQIWIAGRNICAHVDRSEVRTALEWYLLPMLEWWTESWDFLFHEQRLPVSNAGDTAWKSLAETNRPERLERAGTWDADADEAHTLWTSHHCLRVCRFGGLFPDLVIRRLRDNVEFSWGESAQVGAPEGFSFLHGTGNASMEPDWVTNPLFEILRQAASALLDEQPKSNRLLTLRDQIADLANLDRQISRTALLAGLGAAPKNWLTQWKHLLAQLHAEYAGYRESIKRWFEPTGTNPLCVAGCCEASVMFGAASPTLTERDVLNIATHLVKSAAETPSKRWTDLTKEPQPLPAHESPYIDGYRLAQEWAERAEIHPSENGAVDIETHLAMLGVTFANLELDDAATAGLAVQPTGGAPNIFVNLRNPRCRYHSGRRFLIAHELCHLLHDRDHGRDLAMISGPWAPLGLEQRANAFAAALLMPTQFLKDSFGSDVELSYGHLLALAKRLQVSTDALAHHLANCRLISVENRDVLLDQLVNR